MAEYSNFSGVIFTLNQNPSNNDVVDFYSSNGYRIKMIFVASGTNGYVRSSGYMEVVIGSSLSITESRIVNYAFKNNSNKLRFIKDGSSAFSYEILDVTGASNWLILQFPSYASVTKTAGSYDSRIDITSITPIISNTCSDTVQVSFEMNTITDSVTISSYGVSDTIIAVNGEVFTIDMQRGITYSVTTFTSPGVFNEATRTFIEPFKPIVISPEVDYINTGAVIRVPYRFEKNPDGLGNTFETALFSIDGTNYQTSTSFPNLNNGTYTVYAKDAFGCVVTEDVIVDAELGLTLKSNVYFGQANSFNWACQEEINNCDNYARLDNTLSFQEKNLNNKGFTHLLQNCDVVTNQFRSDNNNLQCFLKNCNSEVEIPIFKKTNNINKTAVLDALQTRADDANITILYFSDGKIPSFFKVGDFLELPDGIFKYEDTFVGSNSISYIITDRVHNVDYGIVENTTITYNYSSGATDIFEIPFSCANLNGKYWLELRAAVGNIYKSWCSEIFDVQEFHPDTYEIIASNSVNNEINYNLSDGLKHIFRLPYEIDKTYIGEDDIDVFDTDSQIVHMGATVKDIWEFDFKPLPTSMIKKLKRVFSLDQLYIDREGYFKEGSIDIGRIGRTDLYTFKVRLRENGDYFDSNSFIEVVEEEKQVGYIKMDNSGIGFIDSDISGSPIGGN